MYIPFATTGLASPKRFHVGSRVEFIDPPLAASFIPAGITGTITGRVGYRAFEVACDGHALSVIDLPENMRKSARRVPYAPTTRFVSKRKQS